MCGIVGYAGEKQAAPILLEGLSKLEYRGYDSAGICVYTPEGLQVEKAKGRLQQLRDKVDDGRSVHGTVGIGHTRWATHGAPSDVNSHPHVSDSGKIALVHNGIIENEAELRHWLKERGVCFRSETDTEVVANLVGYFYEQGDNFLLAVRRALRRVEGSFALGIMCVDHPGTIIAVKKDHYLICGDNSMAVEKVLPEDILAVASGFFKDGKYVSCRDEAYLAYVVDRWKDFSARKLIGKTPGEETFEAVEMRTRKAIKKQGAAKYFLSRVFIPYHQMCMYYPCLRKLPVLLPVFWAVRLVSAVFNTKKRRKLKGELTAITKKKNG